MIANEHAPEIREESTPSKAAGRSASARADFPMGRYWHHRRPRGKSGRRCRFSRLPDAQSLGPPARRGAGAAANRVTSRAVSADPCIVSVVRLQAKPPSLAKRSRRHQSLAARSPALKVSVLQARIFDRPTAVSAFSISQAAGRRSCLAIVEGLRRSHTWRRSHGVSSCGE
jgi:hypothetical protein